MTHEAYHPEKDPQMQKPYVDKTEERNRNGIRHTYVHGGFEGTDLKFSLYFPMKEA